MCVLEIFYSSEPDIWYQEGIKNDIEQFHFSFHWHFKVLLMKIDPQNYFLSI